MPGASGFAGDSAAAAFLPLRALAGVLGFLGEGDLALAALAPFRVALGLAGLAAASATSGVFGFAGEAAAFFPPLRVLAGVLALAVGGGVQDVLFSSHCQPQILNFISPSLLLLSLLPA